MQVEVQKRARSACTTFKALKSEWDEVRGEAQDAMTVFANANLELRTAVSYTHLTLPTKA